MIKNIKGALTRLKVSTKLASNYHDILALIKLVEKANDPVDYAAFHIGDCCCDEIDGKCIVCKAEKWKANFERANV